MYDSKAWLVWRVSVSGGFWSEGREEGMSYPIAGLNKTYRHAGYDVGHPIVVSTSSFLIFHSFWRSRR